MEKDELVKVRIPAGVSDGTTLRVSGAGGAGERGGPAGDLYVALHVQGDPRFAREGDDLITERKISVALAALGGDIDVPTLERPVRIHVPAGTQPDTLMRVRGAGMPRLDGFGHGDLLVRIKVEVPRNLTAEQIRLFETLARSIGDNHVANFR